MVAQREEANFTTVRWRDADLHLLEVNRKRQRKYTIDNVVAACCVRMGICHPSPSSGWNFPPGYRTVTVTCVVCSIMPALLLSSLHSSS
jgi:hypothetical protein